jgi:hypothetical protein
MNDFESDFELELHESRPAPRGELLDSLVSKIGTRPAPVRKSKWQLRLAAVMACAALLGLAGLGGVSVASNAVNKSGRSGNSEQSEGKHGGSPQPKGNKRVPVCLNGSQTVLYFKFKKAVKIVLIKHRGVFATPGRPPTCPAI